MPRAGRTIAAVLASRRFFIAVMVVFVLEALWFVFSAAYPMAFDEEYHVGVIRLFSEHWLPFLSSQPESADSFSAITRDPSYLFHYLLSFPYRVLALFINNETALIIILRCVNVALFAGSLVLFRRLLLRARASPALAHAALAIFVLIPIVPQLAAHVSYDNLLMVMVAWMCLLVATLADNARRRTLDMLPLGTFLLVCIATSLVKYESLPLVAAAVLFVAYLLLRTFGRDTWSKLVSSSRRLPRRAAFVLVSTALLLTGLAAERYAVNLWQYHTLKPKCHMVLTEERCQAFGPWARDHYLAQTKGATDPNPVEYTREWLRGLRHRLFFAISGLHNQYQNYLPLPLPAATAKALAVAGLLAVLFYWRRVFAGRPLLVFMAAMSLLYLAALWFDNYSKFLETGQPVAINGRYLLPILLPLAAVLGRALSLTFRNSVTLKAGAASIVILLFLQGGGVLTFISRSNMNWYWQDPRVIQVNESAQRLLRPLLVEGNKTKN